MLGAGPEKKKKQRGYRNHFCANIGSQYHTDMETMVELKLVTRGHKINQGRDQYYHATREGCEAIGLHKAAIKRALEP